MRGLKRLIELLLGEFMVSDATPGATAVVEVGQRFKRDCATGLILAIWLFGTGFDVPG